MGVIKDVTDLVIQLAERVENRNFAADLRQIQSMIGEIASENAGFHERNIELMEENARLRRTIVSLKEQVAALESEADSTHDSNSASIEPLSDEQDLILSFLAPLREAQLETIAGAISQDILTTEVWLNKLMDRGMVSMFIRMGGPAGYYVTRDGKEYVVENGLIGAL